LSGVAIHKVRHRHENVQNTWIVLRTGYLVESTIKLDWIFTYQIARGLDSDRTQVFGERWTNIRKVGQEYSSSKSQGYPTFVSLTILENRPDLDRTDGQGRAIQCSRRAVLPVDRLLADDLLHPVET
jgi:hypothetical protein